MNSKLKTLIGGIAICGLLPLAVQGAPDPNFHIYLMLGQSNMQGAAPVESQDRTLHPRVRVMQSENCNGIDERYGEWREPFPPLIRCPTEYGLGPGDTFGKTMADAVGDEITIGLVGAAYGGAKIEYFLQDCASYNACTPPYGAISGAPNNGNSGGYQWALDLARQAQEVGVIKGFIFHHGESNSGEQTWPGRVNEYISDLRNDLGLTAEQTPFIAGELPYTGCCSGHNQLVQQIPGVVANGHWVSADGGLGDRGDRLHWNSAAVREMGLRYAAKMLEVADLGPRDCGTVDGSPVCCSITADPDGDGLGTQNNGEACTVTEDTEGWHPANPDDVVAAINVGGTGDAIVFNGIWYASDRHFSRGTTNSTPDVIVGGNGSEVFQSERFGDFSYEIPVANGDYAVQLGMVEIYQTNPGLRSFDVAIEGTTVIEDLDIYEAVGHDSVLLSDAFHVSVSDGSLSIEISTSVDNGTLSSILVRRAGAGGGSSTSSSSSGSSSSSSSSGSNASGSSSGGNPAPTNPSGGGLGWLATILGGVLLIGCRAFGRSARSR